MKRSAHVGLLVMGALGMSAASGAYISQREQACRADPANQADPDARCGHSHASGGHGWFYSRRSGTVTADATGRPGGGAALPATTVSRGGFGSIAHSLGLGSGRS